MTESEHVVLGIVERYTSKETIVTYMGTDLKKYILDDMPSAVSGVDSLYFVIVESWDSEKIRFQATDTFFQFKVAEF